MAMTDLELFERLGIALALGLLIGTERGWSERGAPEGARIAGIRTFGLIGLLGGLWAQIGQKMGMSLLGLAFIGFIAVTVIAYWLRAKQSGDLGITTQVAALITFSLGAVAMQGYLSVAAGAAVHHYLAWP